VNDLKLSHILCTVSLHTILLVPTHAALPTIPIMLESMGEYFT
jgi:hypothetical protein